MTNPKISIIIPVYNTEDYLEETLQSLLNQTMMEDIEVIMVDDGSTDDSRYIIEKYALDYGNFQAYHNDNAGPGIARNYGLDMAKGDYVIFYDSDDYLAPNALETLYRLALRNSSDVVVGNVLRFSRYNEWDDVLYANAFRDFTHDIDSFVLDDEPSLVWDALVTNKLYRRDFLINNNIRFIDEKIFFEDILFALEAHILADTISYSHDIFHHWRLRGDQSSVSQQDKSLVNFENRLKILKLAYDLLKKYDVDYSIFHNLFLKWINHDLKFFIKRFNHYPNDSHERLFNKTCEVVDLIPDELIDSLDTYKKVLFKMIRNRDFDNFLRFAPLENELFENPHIPEFLNDEYRSYMDFDKAIEGEDLLVYINDYSTEEDRLILDIEGTINFLATDDYDVIAKLADENGEEYPLEFDWENADRIIIPFDLIRSHSHSSVKIIYRFKDFTKECYLKSRQRFSIRLDEFDIDLDYGIRSQTYIHYRKTNDNRIDITEIGFDDGQFTLRGTSLSKISRLYIQNIINFDRIEYPVEYIDGSTFTVTIPHGDILNAPVKKWEINCDEALNSIHVKRTLFFNKLYRIKFVESRNKILIENDLINTAEVLYEYADQEVALRSEIASLKSEIEDLEEEIERLNAILDEHNELRSLDFLLNMRKRYNNRFKKDDDS